MACGWAAARIVYTELVQSRREAATDRAAQAQAYRSLFSERASEHAEFTTVHDRPPGPPRPRDRRARDQRRGRRAAGHRGRGAGCSARPAGRTVAQEQVAELTGRVEELEVAAAERADELATWHSDLDVPLPVQDTTSLDIEAVVDLIAWEERVTAGHRPVESEQKHA